MKPLLILIAFFFCFSLVKAQSAKTPKWVPDKGFWVVVSNQKTPKNATVYFYNNDKELIYKELVTGKRINIKRPKICMRLKAVLEQSLVSWEKEKIMKENQQWVASKL